MRGPDPPPVLVRATGLTMTFHGGRRGSVRAVDDIDLTIDRGTVLGLVGESGSGKSTVGRLLLRLLAPDAGALSYDGIDVLAASREALKGLRRRMQVVFQDNEGSLDPRMTAGAAVREGLDIHRIDTLAGRRRRVAALLERVGLDPVYAHRHPHTLSGGQRQRVNIARALALEPEFLIADEPVSALDASIQSQILDLLTRLQRDLGLTMLFISHDLSVVRAISDRIAVMYAGRIVEAGPTAVVFADPRHPYTRLLLASVPLPDPSRRLAPPPVEEGDESPLPPGCAFAPRCPLATDHCRSHRPPPVALEADGQVACFRHEHVPGAAAQDG